MNDLDPVELFFKLTFIVVLVIGIGELILRAVRLRFHPGLPEAQRQRLLEAISSEGILQIAHVPRWKILLFSLVTGLGVFAAYIGWVYLVIYLAEWHLLSPVIALLLVFLPLPWFLYRGWKGTKWARSEMLSGRNATHAVTTTKIAPVLYLRPFHLDDAADRTIFLSSWTAELALVREVWARGAPVLAIGRPGEVDPPAGALRFYVTDDRWQETIANLAPVCSLVILATGDTQGLDWELRYLRTNLDPTRLLLWVSVWVDRQLKPEQRRVQWAQFIKTQGALFPVPLPTDASGIRFIAFDRNWTPIPIPNKTYSVTLWNRVGFLATGTSIAGLRSFLKAAVH